MAKIRMNTLLKSLSAMERAYSILDNHEAATPSQIGSTRAELTIAAIQLRADIGGCEDMEVEPDDIDADEPDQDRDPAANLQGADHPDDPRHGQAALIRAGRL